VDQGVLAITMCFPSVSVSKLSHRMRKSPQEGVGISITLGSLPAFYFVYGYPLRYHVGGWAFLMFASPAFLFFFHWVLGRASHKHAVG
jgi:hypothetical protein